MTAFHDRVEAFLRSHPEISATRFGQMSMGDPTFVHKLRLGRTPRLDTAERVERWMERYDAPRNGGVTTGGAGGGPAGRRRGKPSGLLALAL